MADFLSLAQANPEAYRGCPLGIIGRSRLGYDEIVAARPRLTIGPGHDFFIRLDGDAREAGILMERDEARIVADMETEFRPQNGSGSRRFRCDLRRADAGFTELFEGRWTLIVPPAGTDEAAVEKVAELWRRCGSMVERMEPGHHDKVLAIVSHLPHLIAFTICGTADDLADESRSEVLRFAASGFRDFTRIAASDPTMWRDVFLNNREALLEMLSRFMEDAQAMARAVRWGDAGYIEDKVQRGRKIRRSLIELKQA